MNYILFTDIRVDWETHNVVEGDNKLIDLITMYGKPFPLKDSDDNEIVPPTERKYSSHILAYSKTCVKRPLINRQNKVLMTNGSLMKVESIAEYSPRKYHNHRPQTNPQHHEEEPGLPRSGEKVWKMKFFPGQEKVREF